MSQSLQTQLIDGVLVLTYFDADTGAGLPWGEGIGAITSAITSTDAKAVLLNGAEPLYFRTLEQQQQGYTDQQLQAADQLLAAIENCAVPVVALMNGCVNDFGWQLALCCDYRVASESTMIDLDLLKQGSIPGFGGSQRLPRLVGMKEASALLSGAAPLTAAAAKATGLVDLLNNGVIEHSTVSLAPDVVSLVSAGCRNISRANDLDSVEGKEVLDKLKVTFARRRSAQIAPQKLIKALTAALEHELNQGLALERVLFLEMQKNEQCKALSYLAVSEQQANHIPGLASGLEVPAAKSAAIIGSGTMGGGIAMCFANAGIPVTIIDNAEQNLQRGLSVIKRNYEINVKRGSISQQQMDQCWGQVTGSLDYEDIANADIVIEAVFEDMALKKQIFTKLDQVMKPGALLGSNTSGLDIDEIASATKRPGDVIGLHFFSPANVMKLLEVVRGTKVSDQTILRAMSLAKTINKVAVLAGNCPGFIGNRMIRGYMQQGANLILEGASIEQVDRVVVQFGMPMGPFAMGDLTGLDVGWRARQASGKAPGLTDHLPNKLCEMERFGQKSAAGYYRYEEGSRRPIVDPVVEELVEQISQEQGIPRREFDDEEVLRRCLYPLINEGANIIDEGIAIRASDIDTVYVNGYGFPAYRGGPMYWANQIGLDKVYQEIENYHQQFGDFWKPANLLKELAQKKQSFS
jgi:3-hydroxyacyl-CoA dehydrogenase